MNITTRHFATIQFHFNNDVDDKRKYHLRDVFEEQIKYLSEQFDIVENTDFRCQWEGYEMESENLSDLIEASNLFMAVFNEYPNDVKVI